MWPFDLKRKKKMPRLSSGAARMAALIEMRGIAHVVDVGANDGGYGRERRASGYAGPITSIEPGSAAHRRLCEHARSDPDWHVLPRMALGAACGQAPLHITDRSDMNSMLKPVQTTFDTWPRLRMTGTEEVPVRTLDDLSHRELADVGWSRALLKIDAQGSESAILDGARDVLGRLCGIQLELSIVPLYEGEAHYLDVLRRLESEGFVPHVLTEGAFSRPLARQLQIEVLLFRSGESENAQLS